MRPTTKDAGLSATHATPLSTAASPPSRLSRRQFLASVAALELASAAPRPLAQARRTTPQRGGRLRMGIAGGCTSDLLDPARISDAFMTLLSFGQLRNTLVEIDERGGPSPGLAESWDVSADARRWHFRLRRGVEFHNGKTLEAGDVVASINHHRGEGAISPIHSLLDNLRHIRPDGKAGVSCELWDGQADFPFVLADVHLTIQPQGSDVTTGVGAGGYQLVEVEPGVRSLTRRNPNYWKTGRTRFEAVEMLAIAAVNARTATQIAVLVAIKKTVRSGRTAALSISHDLALVAQLADRITVLRHGHIVEEGATPDMLTRAQHAYTRRLLATWRRQPAGQP